MANVTIGDDESRIIKRESFPSNSKSPKKKEKEPSIDKKVEQVTKGKVVRKKKTLSKKFSESFFNDDVGNISQYIVHDVLIPNAKSLVYDIIMNSLGMSLFGQVMPQNIKRNGNKSIVNYGGMSSHLSQSRYSTSSQSRPSVSNRTRNNHSFDDIVLENKWEAEDVLSKMCDMIDRYDEVTVADLYGMIGETASHADQKYGWTNLSRSSVRRDRYGYVLVLPQTEVL